MPKEWCRAFKKDSSSLSYEYLSEIPNFERTFLHIIELSIEYEDQTPHELAIKVTLRARAKGLVQVAKLPSRGLN